MMKRTLRVTLLSILISLTLFTVIVLGVSAFLNSRSTARDLSNQILKQTSLRVDHEIDDLVSVAIREESLNSHLFHAGVLLPVEMSHSRLTSNIVSLISMPLGHGELLAASALQIQRTEHTRQLIVYWQEVLKVHSEMSAIYITFEDDGLTLIVLRKPDARDQLIIQEVRTQDLFGRGSLRNYEPGQYPSNAYYTKTDMPDFDQRRWDWYKIAKNARKPKWTDTYLFFDEKGRIAYPGVSYVAPIYRQDSSLLGVVGIDFNVYKLCDYLKDLDVSENGYVFIVEQRQDGTRQLIAHPDQQVLLHNEIAPDEDRRSELMPLEKISDSRVRAFMAQVSPDLSPGELTEMKAMRFKHGGSTYLGAYRGLEDKQAPNWFVCILIPEDDVLAGAKLHTKISVGVGLLVLIVAIVISLFTAGQVAGPLEDLAKDAEAIGRLEIDPRPVGHSMIKEVDRLATATEGMKTGLRSFRKYVPADLVHDLLASGQEANLGGELRTITIYFSDIANFTSISEGLAPEALVKHLGEYLQILSDQILDTRGTVDKYIGDAIMAFWGAPLANPAHALAACTAAIRNQQKLEELRKKWQAEGKPLFNARIGINTGEVIVGNIGSAKRLNYTVIGDAVNLASRLEGLNKYYGTAMMISESTYQEAREGIVARPLDWVSVKGKHYAVLVYELIGLKGEVSREVEELAEVYQQGLMSYRGQEWSIAIRIFERVLQSWETDAPAREMLRRCRLYLEQPPGADWDGVHRMESK